MIQRGERDHENPIRPYPDGDFAHMWEAAFAMLDLFGKAARSPAGQLGYAYDEAAGGRHPAVYGDGEGRRHREKAMRTGEAGGFIPSSMEELYEALRRQNPPGELSLEGDVILWRLPNGVSLWVCFDAIATAWTDSRGRERPLTHWHPAEEEIFADLLDICQGKTFWVRKKRALWEALPLIMEREHWERLSQRQRGKYEVLG